MSVSQQVEKRVHHIGITRIMLPTEEGFSFYDINKIIRCEGEENITRIYFIDNSKPVLSEIPIGKLEELLSGLLFYRINYNNIINLNHVTKYSNSEGGYVVLIDGSNIAVSQYKINHLIDKLKIIVRSC